jgi:hypothetical protein
LLRALSPSTNIGSTPFPQLFNRAGLSILADELTGSWSVAIGTEAAGALGTAISEDAGPDSFRFGKESVWLRLGPLAFANAGAADAMTRRSAQAEIFIGRPSAIDFERVVHSGVRDRSRRNEGTRPRTGADPATQAQRSPRFAFFGVVEQRVGHITCFVNHLIVESTAPP